MPAKSCIFIQIFTGKVDMIIPNVPSDIMAAIVAAITALVISSISGLYILFKSHRELKNLKVEILTKLSAESIFKDRIYLFDAIRRFQEETNLVQEQMDAGDQSVEVRQLYIDKVFEFYRVTILPFYEKHREALDSKSIDKKINEINELLSTYSENLSDSDRLSNINAVINNIQKIITEVKEGAHGK